MKAAADVVGCTLGPRGHTVLIQRPGQSPLATKDGVTCSKAIHLKDPVQCMGADLIREAASQTNDAAGDGTTTATVLTFALVEFGLKLVESGYDRLQVCQGIEAASRLVDDMLVHGSKQVSNAVEIAQVGTISANGDGEIGKLIAAAMEKVGKDGIITVEDAKGMSTTLDVVEGMQFDRGYLSPYFVTDAERMRATYENARVLVTDKRLSNLKELVPVLEQVARTQQALLIIADDLEGDAMSGLVLNRVKGSLKVVAIKAPGFGMHRSELLKDICVLTGATLVSAATGVSLEKLGLEQLGTCKKFVTDSKTTTLVGSGLTKKAIDDHVTDLRSQLQDVTLVEEEQNKLRNRIARLASGVAVIRVGGATEIEMSERKFRIEDALNATRAAAQEGIVPGGGQALLVCGQVVSAEAKEEKRHRDFIAGMEVMAHACAAPLRKIVENAGLVPEVVLFQLHTENIDKQGLVGYNAATGAFEDLIKAGVIDPVKVTRTALKNAVSVATTFLSLDAVIYEERSPNGNCQG
jgi:chaperonin GroEL